MADSEFYMQCEEDELAPCQSKTDMTNNTGRIYCVHNGNAEALPEPSVSHFHAVPAPAPIVQAPTPAVQASSIKTTRILPVVSGSVVPPQLLTGVLKNIQIATGNIKGQPIYIAPKLPPGIQQNTATSVGYLLPTGQAVTFLAPTQTGAVISPQLTTPSSTPQPMAVHIPVTFIQSPSGIQTVATVSSSAISAVGTSPSTSLPQTFPSVSELLSSSSAPTPPVENDQTPSTPPANNIILVVQTQAASQVPPQVTSIKSRARKSLLPPTNHPKGNQNASKGPHVCPTCRVAYKVVNELRGYMCHCNPDLINSVHALSTKPKKRAKRAKRSSDPIQSVPRNATTSPPSHSSSASSRYQAASPSPPPALPPPPPPPPPPHLGPPCLKFITTSEIPEGVQSPVSGDYDKNGKLIMLVEDFYYGKDPGRPFINDQSPITMKCHLCDKKLKNNIKLMNHMKHHMELEQQRGDVKSHTMCQHCFRNFRTPFALQCHIENVHSQVESSSLCKICEFSYENTPLFLHHMKNFHKPGEMPYICQVCHFRSSFYSDVVIHFREVHKDTSNLLCPYCLKVFKSCNSYQLHYNKHQKKSVLHCEKCRLQFLYTKDKSDHKVLYHQTHIKPPQLLGLKPGTKITIRAYAMTKENDSNDFSKASTNSESSSAPSVPSPPTRVQGVRPVKRKPVESLEEVMTKFQRQCEPSTRWLCIECHFVIPDFSTHFPTFVHCSLCDYSTCCSRAYANHMVSNHGPRRSTRTYLTLYKSCPKFVQLVCGTCGYSSWIGDLIAMHLAKNPSHAFSYLKVNAVRKPNAQLGVSLHGSSSIASLSILNDPHTLSPPKPTESKLVLSPTGVTVCQAGKTPGQDDSPSQDRQPNAQLTVSSHGSSSIASLRILNEPHAVSPPMPTESKLVLSPTGVTVCQAGKTPGQDDNPSQEGFSRGYKRFVFIPNNLVQNAHRLKKQEIQVDQNSLTQVTTPVLLPSRSIIPPATSMQTPSIPSEVQPVVESTAPDENCGTKPTDLKRQKTLLSTEAKPGGSLTVAQLKLVLYTMCFGIPQAANQFDMQPEEVQSLVLKRQLELGQPKSREESVPQASDQIAEWVLCQREQQLPVDETSLFSKAAQVMSAEGASGIFYGWAVDFMINHDLSLQSLATSCRSVPSNVQERLQTFTCVANKQVASHCLGPSAIAAMDEISIFIDMEQLDPASADSSSMMSAFKLVGENDQLLDIVLASLSDGTILPTIVFLRGEPLSPDAPALPDIILEAKPDGFSNEERLRMWFDKVWHRHVKTNSTGKGLLIMDPYRGHLSNQFQALLRRTNTLPAIIPRACSCRLQPLEACVGLVLREFLQARWGQHVMEAPHDLIGAEPADLALLLSAWLLEMLDVLAERPEFLQRSFDPALNSDFAPGGFSELVQNLTEALVMSTSQDEVADDSVDEDKGNCSSVVSPSL